jgi:hypothetical protein
VKLISRLIFLMMAVIFVYVLALAAVRAWGQSVPVTQECATDATTGRVTCKGSAPVEAGAVYNVSGEAVHTSGQRVTFGPSIMPPCLNASHKIEGATLTMEWTCEGGFTILFRVEKRP